MIPTGVHSMTSGVAIVGGILMLAVREPVSTSLENDAQNSQVLDCPEFIGRWVVSKHARHGRQVADVAVDDAE
jgi:hypothetical protein